MTRRMLFISVFLVIFISLPIVDSPAQEKPSAKALKAKEAGETFLAENKLREGVHVTESGLQYEVITQGEGPTPSATDEVVCHYKGTFLDGKELYDTYKKGAPETIPMDAEIIEGWKEAMKMMPAGSKWKVYIPYNLAYGETGTCHGIGPYETLIFEIEVLKIEGK